MKFKVWLDSGANIHSCYEQEIEIDITQEELDSMPEKEREELFRDYAWDRMDWGWEIIEE